MFLILDGDKVIGISDEDTGAYVPDSLREDVESYLTRLDITLLYRNGDLLTETKPAYWQKLFSDFVLRETKPNVLEVVYGETIVFPLSDLPILVSYANECDSGIRSYCDSNGALHVLSTYEWKNVLKQTNDILSNLSNIRHVVSSLKVNNENRFNELCKQVKHKVATAYGRP